MATTMELAPSRFSRGAILSLVVAFDVWGVVATTIGGDPDGNGTSKFVKGYIQPLVVALGIWGVVAAMALMIKQVRMAATVAKWVGLFACLGDGWFGACFIFREPSEPERLDLPFWVQAKDSPAGIFLLEVLGAECMATGIASIFAMFAPKPVPWQLLASLGVQQMLEFVFLRKLQLDPWVQPVNPNTIYSDWHAVAGVAMFFGMAGENFFRKQSEPGKHD